MEIGYEYLHIHAGVWRARESLYLQSLYEAMAPLVLAQVCRKWRFFGGCVFSPSSGSLRYLLWVQLYRKGCLLIVSGFHRKPLMTLVKVLLGKIVWVWWECERESVFGQAVGGWRDLWMWPLLAKNACTLGLTSPSHIFFNLKIFFTFLLLLKGTNSEGFAFRGRRGGDTIFSWWSDSIRHVPRCIGLIPKPAWLYVSLVPK